MFLALTNLDNGLFLDQHGWTADIRLARHFPDTETVSIAARENKVRNAAAVIVNGVPPRKAGFLWVTKPNSLSGDKPARPAK